MVYNVWYSKIHDNLSTIFGWKNILKCSYAICDVT